MPAEGAGRGPEAKRAALKVRATASYADARISRRGQKTKKARSADALLPAFSIARSDNLSRAKCGRAGERRSAPAISDLRVSFGGAVCDRGRDGLKPAPT